MRAPLSLKNEKKIFQFWKSGLFGGKSRTRNRAAPAGGSKKIRKMIFKFKHIQNTGILNTKYL